MQPTGPRQRTGIKFPLNSVILLLIVTSGLAFWLGQQSSDPAKLRELFSRQEKANLNEGLPEDLDYSSVEEVYDALKTSYDGKLSQAELLDGLKHGLAQASGDDYTVYLNAKQSKQFTDDLNGKFTGIGAELGTEKGNLVIVAPLDGFPAQKAGLRAGDIIAKINGKDTNGMPVEEAVQKIRGEAGTKVTLTIVRGTEPTDVTLTREHITVPSVKSEILPGNIGYLKVTRFAEDTPALTRAAANDFKAKKVKGVVLDLRNNSGGLLGAAVDLSGIWLNNEVIVEQRTNGGKLVTDTQSTGSDAILNGVPLVVLVNKGSASASEITAGALQDYGVGKLVGEKTYGKGSVQKLEELGSGGVLKVTIARWYTPKGQNIDKSGIKPDIEVKMTEDDYTAKKDPQRDRAVQLLNQ